MMCWMIQIHYLLLHKVLLSLKVWSDHSQIKTLKLTEMEFPPIAEGFCVDH